MKSPRKALFLTLILLATLIPISLAIIPHAKSETNSLLFSLREHKHSPTYNPDFTFSKSTGTTIRQTTTTASIGKGYIFIIVNREWLHGKYIRWNWKGYSSIPGSNIVLRIYDGSYDRSSDVDFPLGSALLSKGNGILQTLVVQTGTFGPETRDVQADTSGGSETDCMLTFMIGDAWNQRSFWLEIDWIEFNTGAGGAGTLFDEQFTDSVTMERTGTFGDYGYISSGDFEPYISGSIVASDSTVDDEQWFFLNASIEIKPNTGTFLFNRIDIDPAGLNMSCSYTNSTDIFVEENDPNNYLQLDGSTSVKTDLNNTFVRVDYYLRIHPNVTKEGAYNVTVYSTASGGLNDTETYTSVFTLTIRTPSAPTKLYGAGFNGTSPYIELHWKHDMLIFTNFAVQNSTDKMSWGHRGSNTTREFTDETVVNGTERYYRVRACRFTGVGWKYSTWSDINFETVYFVMPIGDGICQGYEFNASSIAVIAGTLNDGNLASTFSIDGDWYNVSETNTPPGLDIRVNFTYVGENVTCGCIEIYQTYTGHSHHEIQIQAWNFTSSTWRKIGKMLFNETVDWVCVGLGHDPEHYLSGGEMWFRFYHPLSGHLAHELQIDRIDLRVVYAGECPECPPCEEAPALVAMGKYYALAIILLILGLLLGYGMRKR